MEEQRVRRRGFAVTLVVLASIAAFLAIFSLWADREVGNTGNWTTTRTKLLGNPVIRERGGSFRVDQLYEKSTVAGALQAAAPRRAELLAGPAAGALRPLAERGANELLARPRGQQAWEAANRAAHLLLLHVLNGGGRAVSTENGVVVLDLKQLLLEMEARVGIGGRVAGKLPADGAQITVLRSGQLNTAQDAFKTLKALPIVLVGLSLALFAAALAVAPRWRRKAVRAYGIGFIAAGAGALAAGALVGDSVVDSLARTDAARPAIDEVWTIYTSLLRQAAGATIAYGVVMLAGAVLAGPSLAATAIRRTAARGCVWRGGGVLAARPPAATEPRRTAAPVLREPAVSYGVLVVILAVVVLWWAPTPATRNPPLALLLCALVALGFEGLRRQTAREFPDADFGTAQQRTREHLSAAAHALGRRTGPGTAAIVEKAAPQRAGEPGNGGTAPTPDEERLAQLERLGRLHESGALDDEEFRTEKARILANGVGAA